MPDPTPPLTRRATLAGLAALTGLAALPARASAPRRDIAYGPHALQRYDAYLPEAAHAAPLVVFLHGGGWAIGDKANNNVWKAKSAHWNARGIGFVSVNTRLLPEADPMQQAADLARALSHIQQAAPPWGADPNRLVLMGHSAGAHLVALLGADPGLARRWGAQGWSATVALDTAVYDTERYMARKPSRIHARAFGTSRAFWEEASPQARLGPGATPFLLVASAKRREALSAARNFARAAKARKVEAELLEVNLSHAAINATLGEPGAFTEAVDAFLARHGVA
ncbi:alpha/beta hydrolase [Vannielia litorea]|uniref:Acetyl esterase/lipase n=1 Tax=Vannielia litorea TaxID=1217970 RepID=A0A1N6FL96_9RHOB|nr:alpha/beta hydrolase [Vannielia litorea]SIN96049.1 Acetyl esterase/lipase [Vannielia litorea]